MSLRNLPASTEVRSSSFSILVQNSAVYITLHWQQNFSETLTSVVVPTSADGLHVLVSGGIVPTLLLTGEPGAGPAMVSG